MGVEVKQGKHLAFKIPGGKRFVRCDSLSEDYTEAAIAGRISGKQVVAPKQKQTAPNLLIDIQAKLQQAHSPGYERWASVFNLKEMAKTMNYLTEHGLLAYPVESILQRSLDTQTIIGKLDGVTQGLCDGFYAQSNAINGLGMNMMQGFHGVDNAVCNLGFTTQQGFNAANVVALQNQNALQAQLSDCCCTTQRAIDGVNYNMATNTCALQNTMNNNTRDIIDNANANSRDIIDNANANSRAILDYLCQDKISTLQSENQALRLAASQATQNNVIGARIDAATAEILRRTGNDCPVNAVVVQPNTPVQFPTNCCGQFNGWNNGCGGCGC